jgi:hypothetical protein
LWFHREEKWRMEEGRRCEEEEGEDRLHFSDYYPSWIGNKDSKT